MRDAKTKTVERRSILSRCDKCPHRAVIYQKYSGMRLCREHLQQDVLRKVRESLRRTGLFGKSARIIIELDGGRNSVALASILKSTFFLRRDIDLLAVVIDEGARGSSAAAEACRQAELLEIPVQRKRLADIDNQVPSAVGGLEARRSLLLLSAIESEAGIIATARDLDDEALEIFLRYLRGDIGSHELDGDDVHWIRPLARIPKREVRLYAIIEGLRGLADRESCGEELFNQAKRLLSEFDSRHPGTDYSLLRGWERHLSSRVEGAKPLSKDGKYSKPAPR